MINKINWGILAPGHIAHKFASDLKVTPGANLMAVGSRDINRSKEFAKQFGADKAFGSYEDLAKAPEIDVIYIASPHTSHFEHTMLCLENGKNVLCEKPMAMNSRELEIMIKKAKEKNLFLMEAIWTLFLPSYRKFRELITDGTIGDIKFIQADFGLLAPENPSHRIRNKELGGGSLLDIGIYPVFLALDIAGIPEEISSKGILSKTGIDENCSMIFNYPSKNITANLFSTILSQTPVEALVCGTKGRVKLNSMWHIPTSVEIFVNGKTNVLSFKENDFGYKYEIAEVNKCISAGKKESEIFSLSSSSDLHRTLDTIRKQIKLEYPADNK